MTVPTISNLPTVPATSDPNFETEAPALFNHIKNTFVSEMNSAISFINSSTFDATVEFKNANFTAARNFLYMIDTSSAGVSVTLPANPSTGDQLLLMDQKRTFGTNNLTIGRNSQNINGAASDVVSKSTGALIRCIFQSSYGWTVDLYEGEWESGTSAGDLVYTGGNVGIGTSSPSDLLDVQANDATAYSASGSNPIIQVGNINTSANTNFSSIQMFTDGNSRGLVNLNALSNSTANSADFSIQTRHNATIAERMRISSDGKVGIGETNPDAPLHVDSSTGNLVAKFSSSDEDAYISFEDDGTTTPPLVGANDNDLLLWTNNQKRVTIDSTGNVGIGETSPSSKLDIYLTSSFNKISGKYINYRGVGNGTNDGYLLLIPAHTTGTISVKSFVGSILASRGSTANGNESMRAKINVSAAYTNNEGVLELFGNADHFFNKLSIVTFSGVDYIAAYFKQTGGGPANGIFVEDAIVAGLDSNCLTMKLGSEVTVVDSDFGSIVSNISGNVGIGTSSPKGNLDVSGVIEAGTDSSISGSTMLRNRYVGNDYTCNFGTMQSSGAGTIGYAVAPKNGSAGFVSSADVANFARAALEVSYDLKYSTATNQSTTVGNDVALDTKFIVKNDGNVGIGTSAPGAELDVRGALSDTAGGFQFGMGSSTASYFGVRLDTSGDVCFDTYGAPWTERMKIERTTGNVGIGTSLPDAKLDIDIGASNADGLLVTSDNNALVTGDHIKAVSGRGNTDAYNLLKLENSTGTKMIVRGGGNVEVSTGNLVIGTAGKGIDFGVASGSVTSQLLDDYEEGTWSPVVADASSGGNTASGSFSGTYTKIGRVVTVHCYALNINTTGMTSTNSLVIRNLPFQNVGLIAKYGSVRLDSVTFSGYCTAQIGGSASHVSIIENKNGLGNSGLTVGDLNSGVSDIYFGLTYETS